MSALMVEYTVWTSGSKIVISESAEGCGVTEVVQTEENQPMQTLSIIDEDVPLLIEALQRRLADAKARQP